MNSTLFRGRGVTRNAPTVNGSDLNWIVTYFERNTVRIMTKQFDSFFLLYRLLCIWIKVMNFLCRRCSCSLASSS